jgi:hypothetical protein
MSSHIVRWGGLAGVVAAVMWVLSAVLIFLTPPQSVSFTSFSDYLLQIVLLVAYAGTMVAIVGLHALQSGRYGPLGAAGSLITFLGYALSATISAVTVLLGSEALYSFRLIGGLAVLIGSILLGAMTLRARVVPWWCGVLLIVGFPLGDVVDTAIGEGSEAIVLGILWGLVGYALLSSGRAPDQRPVRVSRTSPGSGIW